MAWFALYKWFIPWRKTPYINLISWYKRYLYDMWYESLSEDNKVRERERVQKLENKRIREGEIALEHLSQIMAAMNRMARNIKVENMWI